MGGHRDPPAALLRANRRALFQAVERTGVVAVNETGVAQVAAVFEVVLVFTIATVTIKLDNAVDVLKLRIAWKRRRLTFAEVREDQAEIVAARICADLLLPCAQSFAGSAGCSRQLPAPSNFHPW